MTGTVLPLFAAPRHARAIQLCDRGAHYQEITDELGHANRGVLGSEL